jgi:predicted Ser/Thr protein kinase
MANDQFIQAIGRDIQSHFDHEGKPAGFAEYLGRVLEHPARHCRGAAHYIRDAFDHFGVERSRTPTGETRRFKMFDAAFNEGSGRVAGQEEAQEAIYRLLNNFAREGKVNRLILLHGPNGSAKTSLIRAIARGMEQYSLTEPGALFKFRWLFPTEKLEREAIGFGEKTSGGDRRIETYANLPADEIDAVLECELKDHPLLLIPVEQRQTLFAKLKKEGKLDPEFPIPEYLKRGDLCAQCRRIHDALLAAYGSNSAAVLRHVQVVRMPLSGRYRTGISVVEPQMHVDAGEQQVTASRGLANLPRAIAHLDLFQPRGPLVDANRGLLEYNDLLKRHIDTFKYLLVTCENGQVTLERSTLYLDTVFIGSTNEMLLDAFKEYADFASFKGRLELVRVPYLRRPSQELLIYQDQVPEQGLGRHLAPHTLELAAFWAVLTRLRKPSPPDNATDELKEALSTITPLDKALLYDLGEAPSHISPANARELIHLIPDLYRLHGGDYEGRVGASAREVRMLLMNAAQRDERPCVSPLGLFAGIRELLTDKSVFAFLQVSSDGDFMDQDKILSMVDEHYLDLLEEETAEAMGLVTESSYQELFDRYVQHVSHWLRKEKLSDPVTGSAVAPSAELMAQVEGIIRTGDEDAEKFRKNLISRVGAYALEAERSGSPVQGKPDYARVFPAMFERLRDDFVDKRKGIIRKLLENLLRQMEGARMEPRDEAAAQQTRNLLVERFGYCEACAGEALAYLLQRRFAD